ncbi:MAG: DUF4230 domain-containing protein [Chloroflexia bacterium]
MSKGSNLNDPYDLSDDDYLEMRPRRAVLKPEDAEPRPRVLGQAQAKAPAASPEEPVPGTRAARPEVPTPGTRRAPARNAGCIWLLALAAVVVLACGALGAGVAQNGLSGILGWRPAFPNLFNLTPTVVIQDQGPSVVQQMQALSRLETSRYTIEKVLSGSSGNAIPFTNEKILFVAHGDVTAGVDLSKLRDADVQVTSDTVTLRLPAAEIFSTRLDNQKSYVYDEQTDLFTKGDPQLETRIRQQSEQEITKAALEDGILSAAQSNAEQTLTTLLHSLRYTNVKFLTPLPAPGTPPSATP